MVDIPVLISSVLTSPMEASIANLTEQGALIIGASLPRGTQFQIDYQGQIVYGTVMWAEQDRFGARFPLGLPDGPLLERLHQARSGASPLPGQMRALTGFGRRGLH